MAVTGLVLTTLADAGGGIYRSGNAVFDMSKIYEPNLRIQAAQALDLGFQCRRGTNLMAETTRLLEDSDSHGVRFYSVASEAVAGTPVPPLTGGGEGGFSLWQDGQSWNTNKGPVRSRTNMRLGLNPTGGYYSVDGKGFAYNALVHVLWHELHHLTTLQQHIRQDAPYDPSDPWVGAMVEIAKSFPRTARDPLSPTGDAVLLYKPEQWTARSGSSPT